MKSSEANSALSDILVVGTGGCGLAAALAAAQKGAGVLVLEKTDQPGGGTAFSSRSLRAAGTRFQRAEGIEDDPGRYAEEILQRNQGQSDPALTRRLAQESGRVVEWLADSAGIQFVIRRYAFGHGADRSHTWTEDRTIIDFMMEAVRRHANIRLLFSTPVLSLIIEPDGAVSGIVTEERRLSAHKVILATGGFAASRDWLSHFIPQAVDIPFSGHSGSTGDGLKMALEAGAVLENMGAFQPFPTFIATHHLEVPTNLAMLGAILVDRTGRRFANESHFPGGLGAKMLELPGKQAYEIFDERIYREMEKGLSKIVAAGLLKKAGSANELASAIGVDPSGLEDAVREQNGALGQQDRFGRTFSDPLRAPLYGVKVWVAMFHTQGGLRINTNAQVLRRDGSIIPNLYAGGGLASGVSGPGPEGYLPGNGQLASFGWGRIAGQHAADSLRASR
ncbi:MAG: FAD-dependent oxidoreductase [Deltaproteobacteria bacterium]|nr:FAD-dependent oxidoreductase [Deltaproteobacteria bacterium]MDZ4346002.1 FAD-dependent oxidoreductase [Candidatus Binatia bacterium]